MTESRWRRNVRYYGWTIRTVPPLDFGADIWVDPRSRPDFGEWEGLAHRLGEDQAVNDLGHLMTRTLLRELLLAGGGVEAEYLRLGDALRAAQAESDEHVSKNPSLIGEPWPEFGVHTSVLPILEAHYAFWGMLSWVRAVAERAERPYKGKGGGMVGLLPAMATGPRRDRVEVALAGFRSKTRDCRAFANYILHAGAIPGGGTPSARVERSGQVRIPLPDPPSSSQIASWEQFVAPGDLTPPDDVPWAPRRARPGPRFPALTSSPMTALIDSSEDCHHHGPPAADASPPTRREHA